MSTIRNDQNPTIPSSMESKLRTIQNRLIGRTIVRALAIGVSVLILLMIACMIVDWSLMLFDPATRVSLTAGTLFAAILACCWAAYRPLRRVLGWTAAARRVDDETPLLEERWTTVLTFADPEVHPVNSTTRAMLQHVTSEAVAMGDLVRPQAVTRSVSPHKALVSLAGCLLLCAGFLALNWAQTSILLQRFWNPTADITATRLDSTSGDLTIPRGETAELIAKQSGLTREKAQLTVKYQSGINEVFPLEPVPGFPRQFLHSLRVNESFQYQLSAGDGRTKWHRVTAIDYPLLDEISFRVVPPSYLERTIYVKTWIPSRVKVAEGSRLELLMTPDIPLEQFEMKLTHQPDEGEPHTETLVLQPGSDGSYLFELPLLENLSIEPALLSRHGLTNETRQVCRIEVVPDMAPIARVISPNDEVAVADDDVVKIEFEAHDDHGIETAELVIYDESTREEGKEPQILETRPIDLQEQAHQKHVMMETDLDLKELGLKPGRQISIAIRVTDNRAMTTEEKERIASVMQELKQAVADADEDKSPRQSPNTKTTSGDPGASVEDQQQMIAAANQKPEEPSGVKSSDDQSLTEKSDSSEPAPGETNESAVQPGEPPDDTSPTTTAENKATSASEQEGSGKTGKTPESENKVADATGDHEKPAAVANATDKKPENSETENSGAGEPGEKVAASDPQETKPAEKDAAEGTESSESPDASKDEQAVVSDSSSKPESAEPTDPGDEPMPSTGTNSENVAQQSDETDNSVAGNSNPGRPQEASESKPSGKPQKSTAESVPLNKLLAMSPQASEQGQDVESNRRKLKITQRLAASTDQVKERRPKSSVRDRIVELDKQLAIVESGLQRVLKREIPDADRQQQFEQTDKELLSVEESIADLRNDTKDGQFAFVGLQMVEIGRFHVTPARDHVFAAMQTPVGSDSNTSKSLHHVERAREELAALLKRYDKVVKEEKLQEALEETVTIYEVYVEKAHQLMREARQNKHPLSRKMAVIEVDQAYLDRYAEVLTLRRQMLAELARMLADDPRLASRYLDLIKRRRDSLLEQLSELAERQEDLTTELCGWVAIDESQRSDLWALIVDMRLQSVDGLATDTAEFSEQMVKQLPLSLDADRGTAAAALRFIEDAALLAREISFETRNMYGGADQPGLEKVSQKTAQLLTRLQQTERALDRLSFENDGVDATGTVNEVVEYASARLVELQVVSDRANDWSRTLGHIVKQEYPFMASGDQQRLGIATEQLRVGLLSMENELTQQFQRAAGNPEEPVSLPQEVRELIYELHQVMEGITLNQAAASYSLSVPDLADAELQESKALEGFQMAEDLFEKIRRTVVKYLDEYEVDDPTIDQLQDPTLDQFLEDLEREPNIEVRLGIPRRPNNLRVLADSMRWQEEGGDLLNESLNGARNRMLQARKKMKQQEQQTAETPQENEEEQQRDPDNDVKDLEEMIRRSVAKLEEKMENEDITEPERKRLEAISENMKRFLNKSRDQLPAQQLWRKIAESDQAEAMLKAMARGEAIPDQQWNKILSRLNEGLWQIRGRTPPVEYRKSIEQYQDQFRRLIDAGADLPEPSEATSSK